MADKVLKYTADQIDSLLGKIDKSRPIYLAKGDYLNATTGNIQEELAKDGGYSGLVQQIIDCQLVLQEKNGSTTQYYPALRQSGNGTSISFYVITYSSAYTYLKYIYISFDGSITTINNQLLPPPTPPTITVDDELSDTSTNPVQNKVITEEISRISAKVFPLTISASGSATYEIGTTQNVTVNWTIKEGDTVTVPDTLTINGEPVDVESTSKTFQQVTTTTSYKIEAKKGSQTASATVTATFVNPKYFGVVAATITNPTETDIKSKTKIVASGKGYTGTTSLIDQKLLYAYPVSYGTLTSIKDGNNFEYINSYTRSTVNVNGVNYYCYLLTDATTINNFKQIYS